MKAMPATLSPVTSRQRSLSQRGNSLRQPQDVLNEGFKQYYANSHHGTANPKGVVNMGTSQNNLCYDLLCKRLTKPDMLHVEPTLLKYPNWKGHLFLREAVANFLSHYCQAPSALRADNVVVMNGCGSLFSSIAAAVCDPGDAFLIPTPFYGGIANYLRLYSDVRLFHVELDCEDFRNDTRRFNLSVAQLEESLLKAKTKGVNIRGLILVNPHNPLAVVYSLEEMTDFLEFAKRHELHVIVDEVYMLSVFDTSVTFHSVLSLDRLPDPQKTHVLWGLSKDFAMPGLRMSAVYTVSRDLIEALEKLASFHGVSGTTQHQVAQLLNDRDWISGEFLPENWRRLQAAHRYVTGELQTLGIPYIHSPAGLYVWADFRKYLRESSFSEELSLWRCFVKHKVVLVFGKFFSCTTPGWFRIVFSDQRDVLTLGMERIGMALKEMTQLLQDSVHSSDNEEKRGEMSPMKEVGEDAEYDKARDYSTSACLTKDWTVKEERVQTMHVGSCDFFAHCALLYREPPVNIQLWSDGVAETTDSAMRLQQFRNQKS